MGMVRTLILFLYFSQQEVRRMYASFLEDKEIFLDGKWEKGKSVDLVINYL